MHRPPDIDNFGDFYTYYRNRWIGIPVEHLKGQLPDASLKGVLQGTSVPITLIDNQGSENKLLFASYLPHSGHALAEHTIIPYKMLLAQAQFGQPQIGMIQYGQTAAFYERGSPRIAHRGLPGPRRTDFYVINGFATRNDTPSIGTLVWQCFNPSFFTFRDALDTVAHKTRTASPISADWAIGRDEESVLLWFRTRPVASIELGNTVRMFQNMDGEAEILEIENIIPSNWAIRRA